jgi:transcriptional regulator with XRE-family HTH domain
MVSDMTLGGRVRARREELGWSERALADATGLSKMQVHRIETGTRKKLSAGEIAVLAEALDMSVEALLGAERRGSVLSSLAARVARDEVRPEFSAALGRAGQIIQLMDRLPLHNQPQVTRWWDAPHGGLEIERGARMAAQIRSALGLAHDEPVEDIQLVCERDFGLAVALEPLPAGLRGLVVSLADTDGYEPVRSLALVDTARQPHGGQRFTAAHELSHVLFGDFDGQLVRLDPERDPSNQPAAARYMEMRANAFAAEFLAPLSAVQQMLAPVREAEDDQYLAAVARMALHLGISWDFAGRRAAEGDPHHTVTWFKRHARGRTLQRLGLSEEWERAEQEVGDAPPPLVLHASLAALAAGAVSIFEIAELYRTTDIQGLERALQASGWLDAHVAAV